LTKIWRAGTWRAEFDAGFVLFNDDAIAAVVEFWGLGDVVNAERDAVFPVVFGAALEVLKAEGLIVESAAGESEEESEEEGDCFHGSFV
jgi:hypothetical protein